MLMQAWFAEPCTMFQEIYAIFLCAPLFTSGKQSPDISPLGTFSHIRFPRITADVSLQTLQNQKPPLSGPLLHALLRASS